MKKKASLQADPKKRKAEDILENTLQNMDPEHPIPGLTLWEDLSPIARAHMGSLLAAEVPEIDRAKTWAFDYYLHAASTVGNLVAAEEADEFLEEAKRYSGDFDREVKVAQDNWEECMARFEEAREKLDELLQHRQQMKKDASAVMKAQAKYYQSIGKPSQRGRKKPH